MQGNIKSKHSEFRIARIVAGVNRQWARVDRLKLNGGRVSKVKRNE